MPTDPSLSSERARTAHAEPSGAVRPPFRGPLARPYDHPQGRWTHLTSSSENPGTSRPALARAARRRLGALCRRLRQGGVDRARTFPESSWCTAGTRGDVATSIPASGCALTRFHIAVRPFATNQINRSIKDLVIV
ncbi:hypothetical protein PsYK624_083780 [Phanerochaete sordida]|uniref:Uncharacterized protein n=1 Tax=Phanerochaete sordida TaxID=48140 RepID=A0A9P3GCM5_9APHY|nr:hypothetical protein PsYK624_083780 [Phanerochaete sordida]